MNHSKNGNRALQNSARDLPSFLQEVLAVAQKKGATDAMVTISEDNGFSVEARMREVSTVAFHENKAMSLVLYLGESKGEASSTDISSKAIEELVDAAISIAKVSAKDACFGLPDRELMKTTYPDLALYHPWDLEPKNAIELALELEEEALSLDRRIINSDGANVVTHQFSQAFANTHGGQGLVRGSMHSISCSLVAEAKGKMQREYEYTSARNPAELATLPYLAQNVVQRTVGRLGARKIKTQHAPVLFSPRVSSSLISSFISAISGSNLYRKNSFLLDSMGKTVFPSFLHIYEQPYLLQGLGSFPFDDEGVPTRNNVFVQEGRVSQYVLGSYSARRMGMKTTANSGGTHNLTVSPTKGELPELLQMMGRGLLVTELMGQGVNGLTGDYSRGAAGFWVENGEIQYPVEEITIAGNLKKMFLDIQAVGKDIDPNRATRCGSILVEAMMIAGS